MQLLLPEAKQKGHVQVPGSGYTSFEVKHESKREDNVTSGKQADMTQPAVKGCFGKLSQTCSI